MLFYCFVSLSLSLHLLQLLPSICLNCFVSADMLFVLSIPFNSCQINSDKLINPSEFVVGAAVPALLCGD